MPGLDLVSLGGTVRVFTLLDDAHAILLNLGKLQQRRLAALGLM